MKIYRSQVQPIVLLRLDAVVNRPVLLTCNVATSARDFIGTTGSLGAIAESMAILRCHTTLAVCGNQSTQLNLRKRFSRRQQNASNHWAASSDPITKQRWNAAPVYYIVMVL